MKINRNIFWSEIFVDQLVSLGVEQVCISPGSRSTPLTLAFAENPAIKKFVHIDERSSAFFALGLAKQSKKPVAIVTTSGTAVAELYPAIVESFQHRVPMIICTADRPAGLRETGANQTINQVNIFANHIRDFYDFDLPDICSEAIETLKKISCRAVEVSYKLNPGPVHLNFQFDKPFEPDNFTDDIDKQLFKKFTIPYKPAAIDQTGNTIPETDFINLLKKNEKGLIICGSNNFSGKEKQKIIDVAEYLHYPIFADGASGLRFGFNSKFLISNFSGFLNSTDLCNSIAPELIIQFGAVPTSNILLKFFENFSVKKILINEYGDLQDPSKTVNTIIGTATETFADLVFQAKINRAENYSVKIKEIELKTEIAKNSFLSDCDHSFEGKVISDLITALPTECNLFISNSMPVRDLDLFVSSTLKSIGLFENRGASGIDGVLSTALGIAANSQIPTYLIIGDLSFNYDLTSLQTAVKYNIPLKMFVLNNNGGGIFQMLPVSGQIKHFDEFFNTSVPTNYQKIADAFGIKYNKLDAFENVGQIIENANKDNCPELFEILTDSKKSADLRKEYIRRISGLCDENPS